MDILWDTATNEVGVFQEYKELAGRATVSWYKILRTRSHHSLIWFRLIPYPFALNFFLKKYDVSITSYI